MFHSLFVIIVYTISIVSSTIINIRNNCPNSLDIFLGANYAGRIPPQGLRRVTAPTSSLEIYANAKGGTYAGFYSPYNYYYIVRNPFSFNVGVSITPADELPDNGSCKTTSCDGPNCPDGFPPSFCQINQISVQPVQGLPPSPPLYECNNNTVYNVTWCPNGVMPVQPTISSVIHPTGNSAKCVGIQGNMLTNGTPVQVHDCDGSNFQRWFISSGSNQVKLAETDFCLDAGTDIYDGAGVKIWHCFDGLPQQSWYYTNDDRIAVTNSGKCLDVTNGVVTNGNQLQIWQCADGNSNQYFPSILIPNH